VLTQKEKKKFSPGKTFTLEIYSSTFFATYQTLLWMPIGRAKKKRESRT